MNLDLLVSETDLIFRLGWTLLHFLWQGTVLAAVCAIVHSSLHKHSPNARYLTGCLILSLMLAAPIITFAWISNASTETSASMAHHESAGPAVPLMVVEDANPSNHQRPSEKGLNVISFESERIIRGSVVFWLAGVAVMSLRLMLGTIQVFRMKHCKGDPLSNNWNQRIVRLKTALEIHQPVRIIKSALVSVPAVVGWIRPVILLPASCLTGLTPPQLEAVLAHELAHIRRADYLVNMIQNVLETLLFYHPAVWWVSTWVRTERENCCDDLAVEVCRDRLIYSRALAAIEEHRATIPVLALGVDGGSLSGRIRRLCGVPDESRPRSGQKTGGVLLIATALLMFVFVLPTNSLERCFLH